MLCYKIQPQIILRITEPYDRTAYFNGEIQRQAPQRKFYFYEK